MSGRGPNFLEGDDVDPRGSGVEVSKLGADQQVRITCRELERTRIDTVNMAPTSRRNKQLDIPY